MIPLLNSCKIYWCQTLLGRKLSGNLPTWPLNQWGFMLKGGLMFKMCEFFPTFRYGMQAWELIITSRNKNPNQISANFTELMYSYTFLEKIDRSLVSSLMTYCLHYTLITYRKLTTNMCLWHWYYSWGHIWNRNNKSALTIKCSCAQTSSKGPFHTVGKDMLVPSNTVVIYYPTCTKITSKNNAKNWEVQP